MAHDQSASGLDRDSPHLPTVPQESDRPAKTGEPSLELSEAIALLVHYFELAPPGARLLAQSWASVCSPSWVRSAVIEALYQGRYKPVSVEQILLIWQRRGKPLCRYNREFESLIAIPIQGKILRLSEPTNFGYLASEAIASAPVTPDAISAPAVSGAMPGAISESMTSEPASPPPPSLPTLSTQTLPKPSALSRLLAILPDSPSVLPPSPDEALPGSAIAADPSAPANPSFPPVPPSSPTPENLSRFPSFTTTPHPLEIHQFTPTPCPSGFMERLREVAELRDPRPPSLHPHDSGTVVQPDPSAHSTLQGTTLQSVGGQGDRGQGDRGQGDRRESDPTPGDTVVPLAMEGLPQTLLNGISEPVEGS